MFAAGRRCATVMEPAPIFSATQQLDAGNYATRRAAQCVSGRFLRPAEVVDAAGRTRRRSLEAGRPRMVSDAFGEHQTLFHTPFFRLFASFRAHTSAPRPVAVPSLSAGFTQRRRFCAGRMCLDSSHCLTPVAHTDRIAPIASVYTCDDIEQGILLPLRAYQLCVKLDPCMRRRRDEPTWAPGGAAL
ncbi:hypothetical protein MRX96_010646 [Rhipicephalus microplus]